MIMNSPGTTTTGDGIRKRPPKGLRRACWECKRRKLTADCSSDIPSSPSLMAFGQEKVDDDNTCSIHIGERLSKLEQLFERFVCRKNSVTGASSDTVRSPTLVGSNENQHKFGLPEIHSDAQSISTIGDGILGAQNWTSAPAFRSLPSPQESVPSSSQGDSIHRSLSALLPSQTDADIIFESSNGWMILDGCYRPARDIYVNRDRQSYALDMQAVTRERPIIIARTLLHLAICINCLPPEFESTRLSSIWNLEATMQNYVNTVQSLVTSSDEQMLTLHGLETLLLLALYYMNNASLRQAWLIIRRGLNLAHLMGFQHIINQPDIDPPIAAVADAKAIWRNFVDFDRFLGLHLRLPFGAEEYPLPDDADSHHVHRSRINAITRQVAELDRDVSPQAYSTALALDEKLESSMKEMPRDFWDVPNVPSTARSPESLATLERLCVQMWHFEMKVFIHLPYLLRAPQESRYEFSKVTALQASRNMLMRWFALRNAGITQACCRFAELGVFIAAVTLTLDIIIEIGTKEKSEVQKTKGTDFAMLCRLIGEMEKLSKASPREKIAARSAQVLKKMLSSLDPNKQSEGKARLTIPFFGTIELNYKKPPRRPPFDIDSETGKKMNATGTGQHLPVFSFISNALWPPVEEGPGSDFDWDIVLFDGLEDRDTEGNWMF